jgi:hypothetical protein
MKTILSFVFSLVALSTIATAQPKRPIKKKPAPQIVNAKVVTEAEFMANAASFNGTAITIKNVSLRPRIEVKAECKTIPVGDRPITVEFASAPKWNAVCFSIDQDDKENLKENQGPTKADITLKGNADKGFRIISYKKN